MQITSKFSRYYHGAILNDIFKKVNSIQFRHLKDTRTGGAFRITKYEDFNDVDDLKQLLKLLNLDYPNDLENDDKTSTKDINTKDLLDHVEWLFKIMAYNQIELKVVTEEWQRMIEMYNR